jgi:hypothetical protein
MNQSTLPRRSTLTVELVGLQDTETLAYLSTATATLQLLDPTGNIVASGTLALVAGTSGPTVTYRGSIAASVTLSTGSYTVRVLATDASGNKREFNIVKPPVNG